MLRRGGAMSWYIALGDSMSIDLYPLLELREQGRVGPAETRAVGAASLLHRNDDALWPEFAGRDLVHSFRGMERLDLCVDGATIAHTLELQLPRVPREVAAATRVVTVTAGGNDLLGGLFDGLGGLTAATDAAVARYEQLADAVARTFPSATLLLTTVYDPTDGSGLLPGVSEILGRLPMELLDSFNHAVRQAAARHARARVADAHGRFLGHGLSAPGGERWYWEPSPIEPGARGASEIRRVWLEALGV